MLNSNYLHRFYQYDSDDKYLQEFQLCFDQKQIGLKRIDLVLLDPQHSHRFHTVVHAFRRHESFGIGHVYFDDYFYANGVKNTKRWIKLNSVFGRLNVLGAGYAQDSSGNAYFNGAKMKSIFGRLRVLTSEKWREITISICCL